MIYSKKWMVVPYEKNGIERIQLQDNKIKKISNSLEDLKEISKTTTDKIQNYTDSVISPQKDNIDNKSDTIEILKQILAKYVDPALNQKKKRKKKETILNNQPILENPTTPTNTHNSSFYRKPAFNTRLARTKFIINPEKTKVDDKIDKNNEEQDKLLEKSLNNSKFLDSYDSWEHVPLNDINNKTHYRENYQNLTDDEKKS